MSLAKHSSTLFLKAVVVLIGLAVLALCVFLLPAGIMDDRAGMYRPILIGMYVPAIPFFIGIYQTLKLLNFIDTKKAFSESSIRTLRYIKYCALTIGGLYAVGLPYIYTVAERDDAPGVMLLGLIFTFAPIAIGVFTAVLQKLLQNAINIKSENDLTV